MSVATIFANGATVSVDGGAASLGSPPAGVVTIYAGGASVELKAAPTAAFVPSKYRDGQFYLFQRVKAIYEPKRFPAGTDHPYEYWVRQTAPGMVAPGGNGWFPGGFNGGPTKYSVCPETEWKWNRAGGDVLSLVTPGNYANLVRNPQTLIPWHVSPPIGTVAGQQTFSLPCTQLLQYVQTNNRWCALLLRKQTGTARAISTRFAGSPATPPTLSVAYTDGASEVIPCWVITSTLDQYSRQTHPTPPTECFVEFARPSKPVASAALNFTVVGGSAVATYGLWLLDPPRNTDPVTTGIAANAPLDSALESEPSIIDVHQFPDSMPVAELAAKYINNAVTNAQVSGEAYYDPALWDRGPTDTTKLPHTCRNQWLFADNARDATMTPVPSTHRENGFFPLAPGIGAMRIQRLPAPLFGGDGSTYPGCDDGHNLASQILLPADDWGLDHIFTRAYYFWSAPERETMAMKFNYWDTYASPDKANWTNQGGKTLIMPYCPAGTYNSGFSGTSGGGRGWQARGAWTSPGAVNDDGPLTGGLSLGLHTFDQSGSNNPPGFGIGSVSRLGQRAGRGGMVYMRQWYCVEWEIKVNDVLDASGAIIGKIAANNMLGGFLPNGEIRCWIDGVLVFEITGLVIRTLPMLYEYHADPAGGNAWVYNQTNPASITNPGYIANKTRPARNLGIRSLLFNWYHGGQTPLGQYMEMYYAQLGYGRERIGPMRMAA